MGTAIRSEFLKFFTTRLWWGMAIAIFVCGAAFAGLFAFLYTSDTMTQSAGPGMPAPSGSPVQIANSVYTAGIGIGYLLQAMGAKVIALLGIGALYGAISLVGSVAVGATVLSLRGFEAFPGSEVYRTLALSLVVLGLWALIGLGIGILIPNQVAALLIGVGVAWIVEPLVSFGLSFWTWGAEHLVPYFPSQATTAVVDAVATQPNDSRLSWWAASLVLIAYAAVLSGLGIWRVNRQDIT